MNAFNHELHHKAKLIDKLEKMSKYGVIYHFSRIISVLARVCMYKQSLGESLFDPNYPRTDEERKQTQEYISYFDDRALQTIRDLHTSLTVFLEKHDNGVKDSDQDLNEELELKTEKFRNCTNCFFETYEKNKTGA